VAHGVSSVLINLPEGNFYELIMIPPYPQKPSNLDIRYLALGLQQLNLIEK
jgi:hypothetical protein